MTDKQSNRIIRHALNKHYWFQPSNINETEVTFWLFGWYGYGYGFVVISVVRSMGHTFTPSPAGERSARPDTNTLNIHGDGLLTILTDDSGCFLTQLPHWPILLKFGWLWHNLEIDFIVLSAELSFRQRTAMYVCLASGQYSYLSKHERGFRRHNWVGLTLNSAKWTLFQYG